MYVDESGDHVFHDKESLAKPPHRFLALIGCMLKRGKDYVNFSDRLEALKRKHLTFDPDEPVILHRSDIVNARGSFWRLRNSQLREEWDKDLLRFMADTDFRVIISIVDKLKLKQNYPDPWHPYHLAFTHLLQRYVFELNHINRRGDVLAESRRGTEDRLLKNAYTHVYVHGDTKNPSKIYQQALTSRELKLKPKYKNIAGLQLADLLAHPLRKRVLVKEHLLSGTPTAFEQRLRQVTEPKWRRSPYNRSIPRFGYVIFPK